MICTSTTCISHPVSCVEHAGLTPLDCPKSVRAHHCIVLANIAIGFILENRRRLQRVRAGTNPLRSVFYRREAFIEIRHGTVQRLHVLWRGMLSNVSLLTRSGN